MNTCERCNGTGLEDSGAIQPRGEKILVECECRLKGRGMDESRKQFEEWYASSWRLRDDELRRELAVEDNGDYIYSCAYNSWRAWTASRAAIEIELPIPAYSRPDIQSATMHRVNLCKESIRAAGIKVKE